MEKKDIVSYNYDELQDEIKSIGEKPFRAKQIYAWLHEKLAEEFDEMTNLSKALREKLDQAYEIRKVKVVAHQISKVDPTEKFLFELEDGNRIESVLMKYNYGNSVCISSQVGCRMGCRFCASTLDGLERNLTTSEMLRQIYQIQKMTGERVSNVVVMGTGEPLDNYDNHKGKFLKRINWIYRILWLVYGRSYRAYSSIEIRTHLKKGEVSFLPKLLFYYILKPFRAIAKMGIRKIQDILLSIPETNKIWTYDVKSSLSVVFSKDWFGNGVKLPFENLEIKVPTKYDKVLKTYYGDYMTPPPTTQRQSQHYRYFIDLEKRYSRKEIMEKMYGKRKKN